MCIRDSRLALRGTSANSAAVYSSMVNPHLAQQSLIFCIGTSIPGSVSSFERSVLSGASYRNKANLIKTFFSIYKYIRCCHSRGGVVEALAAVRPNERFALTVN